MIIPCFGSHFVQIDKPSRIIDSSTHFESLSFDCSQECNFGGVSD